MLAKEYPDICTIDSDGNFKIAKSVSSGAKYLYKTFPKNPHFGNEKVISAMFEQYNIFSKVEHLSKLTPAVLNIEYEKKLEEIRKSKFFFLLHLDNMFQIFKEVDSNFNEPFRSIRGKVDDYFEPKT